MIDSRQEAYKTIISRAIPIANADARLPFWLKGHYKPPITWETLAIEWPVDDVRTAIQGAKKHYASEVRSEEEIMMVFVQVARDAVEKALRMEPEALGYLMLENIRNASTARTNGTI